MNFTIVQHCFGKPASGGPVVAMERLISRAPVSFIEMRQTEPAGGVNFRLLRDFFVLLRRSKPDLVHVRGLGNEGFHAALAARLARVPNVLVSIHGTQRDLVFPTHPFRHWIVTRILEPFTLHIATHLATVCEYAAKRAFLEKYRKKIVAIVPNGVELPSALVSTFDVKERFEIPHHMPLAVTVSRITKEKGFSSLADALKLLDEAQISLAIIVVGGGDEDGNIRALFANLKNVVVRFVGHQSDVSNFLLQADFFVFPSLHENLSNALLEAMSFGLPVIASDVGGNTEVLSHGGGVLVPSGNADSLAKAIQNMLNDNVSRSRMSSEAKQTIQQHYSVDHMVTNWLTVYEQILGGRLGER